MHFLQRLSTPSSSAHILCDLGRQAVAAFAAQQPANTLHATSVNCGNCFVSRSCKAKQRLSTLIQLQAPSLGGGNAGVVCQRCLQTGHWTYECKNAPVYKARPTRTQQLMQPKVRWRRLSLTSVANLGPMSFANGGSGAPLDPARGSGCSGNSLAELQLPPRLSATHLAHRAARALLTCMSRKLLSNHSCTSATDNMLHANTNQALAARSCHTGSKFLDSCKTWCSLQRMS
jgi:Zinc knuckle